MKKRFLLLAILLFGCAALTSCEKGTPIDEPTEDTKDKSLAGSMLVKHAVLEAEVKYDGKSWELPEGDIIASWVYSDKVSDTEQRVEYDVNGNATPCKVTIPALPLIGEPFAEVQFDHTCTDATVKLKGVEYTNVSAKVKGWVKKVSMQTPEEYTSWVNNGRGFRGSDYTCDIEVTCTVDGKELWFRITMLQAPH